jgi:hypothetical protein
LVGLGVILPPGTLIVISQSFTQHSSLSIPTLNWTNTALWLDPTHGGNEVGDLPSSQVTRLVGQTIESMETLRFPVPTANMSYSFPLQGPFLQCEPPNSTQIPVFQEYAQALHDQMSWITSANWNQSIGMQQSTVPGIIPYLPMNLIVYSAFDPTIRGWLNHLEPEVDGTDKFNNWDPNIPDNATGYFTPHDPSPSTPEEEFQMVPRQIWILTANDSLVCTMGNATRDVYVDIVDSEQAVSYSPLRDFDPVMVPRLGTTSYAVNTTDEQRSFVQQYVAMISFLSGNVTMLYEGQESNIAALKVLSSNIFLTGLVACDEFVHTYCEISSFLFKKYATEI